MADEKWVIVVEYNSGETAEFSFASEDQAAHAVEEIQNAKPGELVQIADYVFVPKSNVLTIQTERRNAP